MSILVVTLLTVSPFLLAGGASSLRVGQDGKAGTPVQGSDQKQGSGKSKSTSAGNAKAQKPPPVERITENVYRVGKAMVDLSARTVSCPARINMDSGAIEYIAVTPNGKTHESLLEVDVRPLYLQVALLLLDLEPKNVLRAQGDPATPQGAPVDLFVRWRDGNGVEQEVRVEEWVLELPSAKPLSNHFWVFTGSKVVPEGFVADLDKSLVAVWHDPAAIVDNPRPDGANNAHIVNSRLTNQHRVPKRGTEVTFIIKAASRADSGSSSVQKVQKSVQK